MALNVVDPNGVSQQVIRAVKNWRDWLNEEGDSRQQRHLLDLDVPVNRRDAVYSVECLRQSLPREGSVIDPQTTVLSLDDGHISDEAIEVFCDFLLETPLLRALTLWNLPHQQIRRLLESLHSNRSVNELHIFNLQDDEGGLWIADLLRHKNDFTALNFLDCRFPIIKHILPWRRRGLAPLEVLGIPGCHIGDEGVRLLLQALIEGDFSALTQLNLISNQLTSIGLRAVAELLPLALPHLQNLHLGDPNLLDDPVSTQLFVDNMLSSLKKLHIRPCGDCSPIIKACENIQTKLQVLDISHYDRNHHQVIRNQLIESMPKMKGLQHLICNEDLFSRDDRPLMAALFQNTSILEVTSNAETRRHIAPMLQRNRHLANVNVLLRPPTTTTTTWSSTAAGSSESTRTTVRPPSIPPPDGLWIRVLDTVGQGSQGATPMFMVLRDRLATWMTTTSQGANKSKKRKRQDGK